MFEEAHGAGRSVLVREGSELFVLSSSRIFLFAVLVRQVRTKEAQDMEMRGQNMDMRGQNIPAKGRIEIVHVISG